MKENEMKKTALVIMAAGIGSRFGKGIKQLAPVGPNGEIIMDYSIHDALEAGFNKVVFIIRKDIEEEFRSVIGNKIEKITEVEYAFQALEDLPQGFEKPEDRTKPWGTGQAVLAAKKVLSEPFMVINADDYYGKEAYVKVHDYLIQDQPEDGVLHICMAGFRLGNTLSDNGSVTRGICHIENGALVGVTETHDIYKTESGAETRSDDGKATALDVNSLVSMNMWGLTPAFMDALEKGFVEFLTDIQPGDIKKEYLLPEMIDRLIKAGKAKVDVLDTKDTWFGVTYQEDKASVTAAFEKLVKDGVYPENLYK
jgi:dTDP-glucose pyrophosphorylase